MEIYIRPGQKVLSRSYKVETPNNLRKIIAMAMVLLLSVLVLLWVVKDITIKADGKTIKVYTIAGNVKEALNKAGVTLDRKDLVKPELDAPLRHGGLIEVKRAVPVVLNISGEKKSLKTAQSTIQDFLQQEKIKLSKVDRVTPELPAKITPNMQITVIRVSYGSETVEVELPYGVEKKLDDNIESGFSKIAQPGVKGLEKQVFRIVYEDGKEIKREVIEKETLQAPINEIVAVGNLRVVSRGGQSLNFKKAAVMTATGYTHTGHRTATGNMPHRGVVAVDPSVIPLGTRLYIENYGYAVAADTGGAIKGNIVDLFFETNGEACKWGRRAVKVYILE